MTSPQNSVTVIASGSDWIDGKAVAQLHRVAELPQIVRMVGMPDIHAGRNIPVGFAAETNGLVYPHLIGSDIGCGMGLWMTDLSSRKVRLDKWVRKLSDLESAIPSASDYSSGTIGGGNHFAELQQIEEVTDDSAFAKMGLDKRALFLLVHTGSRGLGERILRNYRGAAFHGLSSGSIEFARYLKEHDSAVIWARENRARVATRFLNCLSATGELVLDVEHNFIEKCSRAGHDCFIHRKGASPATRGAVVIPGSRGTFAYLVQPTGDHQQSAFSLPHGAGRKWSRSDCKDRLKHRYSPESLTRTSLGSRVICDNPNLLYQEAPQAYKDIDVIIRGLVETGMTSVLAKLRPLITYKAKR